MRDIGLTIRKLYSFPSLCTTHPIAGSDRSLIRGAAASEIRLLRAWHSRILRHAVIVQVLRANPFVPCLDAPAIGHASRPRRRKRLGIIDDELDLQSLAHVVRIGT